MSEPSLFDDLPFQLPPSTSQPLAPSPPPTTSAAAAAAAASPPATSRPPRTRSRPQPGVGAPPDPSPDSQQAPDQPPPAAPLPVAVSARASSTMPTRRATRRRSHAATVQDQQEGEGEVTTGAPPGPSSAGQHAAASHEQQPSDKKARRGTSSNKLDSVTQPPAPPAASSGLKIVLRAPPRSAASPESFEPAPSTTTGTPIFVRDPSASSSAATSRAETPADRPTSSAASPPASAAPSLHDQPMHVDSPTVPSSGRKGQKKGPDGLNRSCHMHKSHKDPRRMTCINAPDCLTAWCHKCVVKHYLACTPNNAFEPSSLFLCPVCLDVCLCGSCKRKRSLSGRRSASADVADNDATFEPPAPRPKKKPRRTSTSSDVSTVVAPAAETGPGRRARPGREVRPAKADSDSSDDDASVSRLLTGAATTSAVAEGASGAVAMEDVKPVLETPAAVPAAPTAAPPAQPAYTLKVKPPRRRGSLDCAYDRANPFTFRPAPPSQPPAHIATPDPSGPAPAPVPAPAPAPSAAQSSRRQPKGGRPPRAPRIPRPPVAAPAPTLEHAHVHAHGSVFAPTPSTAPTVAAPTVPAPTYNSRPIVPTAAATRSRRTKRPSTAFDDYALDSATSSAAGLGDRYSPSFEPAQMVATAPPSRKGVRPGGAAAASAGAPRGPKRKAPRRYSGLSSASSCDELSSDDDGSYDDLFDDAHAVPMVVEEQPLPVLAGLEKNLEDGAGTAGESLTFDEFGLALSLGTAETLRARPRVKWIEGPERRRRRAMAAAAVAAVAAGETETSDAPTPERDLPVQGSAKSASPSIPSLSLSAPSESATPLGAPGSRAVSEQPAEDVKGNLDASQHRTPDDQPPPYDSHFAPSAATRPPASAPAATATPGDDLRSRSPTDAKLAFALLDAVRAAVAPRDGSSSSGSSAASQGSSGGFGAAIDALFGTSHSSGGASLTSSPVKRSGAASPVPSRPTHTDVDLDAATAEAERRRASLAAAAEVDPVKAFKPLAQDRADAQFFGAPAASTAGPLVEEEDEEERHEGETPVTSRRDAEESATTTAATAFVGFDDVFEFEIGSPVDDLWTPASAADSVGASARSVSTAPSSAFDDRVAAAAAAAAVGVDDGGPIPGSASATPAGDAAAGAPAAAQACVSPTRGLLADALAFGSGAGSAIEGMLPLPLPIPLGGAAHVWGFEVDEAPMEDVCAA